MVGWPQQSVPCLATRRVQTLVVRLAPRLSLGVLVLLFIISFSQGGKLYPSETIDFVDKEKLHQE